jgi:hypothetical protein
MFDWKISFSNKHKMGHCIRHESNFTIHDKLTACSFASCEIHYLLHQRPLELWPIIHTFHGMGIY